MIDSPRFEPGLKGTLQSWIGLELVKPALVGDVIVCAFEISVQHIFGLVLHRIEDGFERSETGASWSEPVGMGFKSGFPFGFAGEFGKVLPCPLDHDGNPPGTLLAFPRLRSLAD